MSHDTICVSAPGRIVLAGEHQDYFQLPVISAAISLRTRITGSITEKPIARLHIESMRKTISIPLNPSTEIQYRYRRSYLQSGMNNVQRAGYRLPGFEAKITSEIPQNAGLSSSSALCVAWAKFLLILAGSEGACTTNAEIADWAHKIEVTEFSEPGGKQDHIASAHGGINYITFPPNSTPTVTPLDIPSEVGIVVGHSLVAKPTIRTVFRVRTQVAQALQQLKGAPALSYLKTLEVSEVPQWKLENQKFQTLRGILKIRDATQNMLLAIKEKKSLSVWGQILQVQHEALRDDLRLSIPKIDRMVEMCLEAGAYGAKINGSGEGGCIYALCPPESARKVAEAVQKGKGRPYIVKIDKGVQID